MRASKPVAIAALAVLAAAVAAGESGAGDAAAAFGRALTSGRAASLRAVLPASGKVQLSLLRLGPEQGTFGPPQVEEVFRDFLARGSVRSFELLQVSVEPNHAVVHARIALTDRDGRPARSRIHLVLQPESGRWVVREIKETGE